MICNPALAFVIAEVTFAVVWSITLVVHRVFDPPAPDVYWVEYENGAITVSLGYMWRNAIITGTHLPSLLYIPGYGWIRYRADRRRDEPIPEVMESKGFDYMDASLNWPLMQSYVESNLSTMQKTISAYIVRDKVRKVKCKP